MKTDSTISKVIVIVLMLLPFSLFAAVAYKYSHKGYQNTDDIEYGPLHEVSEASSPPFGYGGDVYAYAKDIRPPYTATWVSIPESVGFLYAVYENHGTGWIEVEKVLLDCPVTGVNGFDDRTSITSVSIPSSVKSISGFRNCTSLASVTIHPGVKTIYMSAFSGCRSLTDIVLPSSLLHIGDGAFNDCTSLTHITIPSSVTNSISAFSGCTSLVSLIIEPGINGLGDRGYDTFKNLTALEKLSIPSSVKNMQKVFSYCSSLRELTIASGITNMQNVFSYCPSLTNITIPSSVVSVRSSFFRCSSLTHITVPQSVMENELSDAFGHEVKTNLSFIALDESVTSIYENQFRDCSSLITIEVDHNNKHFFVSPDNGCLYDAAKTKLLFCPRDATNITIPDGVTAIGNYAFHQCEKLVSVTMPDSLKEIGMEAFAQCTSLQRVSMPNGLAKIGGWAFYGCEKLSGVTIPPGVTSLPMSAFDDCSTLWTEWYRKLADLSKYGPSYTLAQKEANGVIASITVSDNMALDEFVMSSGKVYDLVLYINNISSNAVTVSLPEGNTYKTFRGAVPLTIPPLSQNILTITRVSEGGMEGDVFLVSREELESVK